MDSSRFQAISKEFKDVASPEFERFGADDAALDRVHQIEMADCPAEQRSLTIARALKKGGEGRRRRRACPALQRLQIRNPQARSRFVLLGVADDQPNGTASRR